MADYGYDDGDDNDISTMTMMIMMDFCSISLKIRIIIKCDFFSSTSILK